MTTGAISRGGAVARAAYECARRDSVGQYEIRFVRDQQERLGRVSWQALSEMLDRPVHDLRMACDADYRRVQGQAGMIAAARMRPLPTLRGRLLQRLAEGPRDSVALTIDEATPVREISAYLQKLLKAGDVASEPHPDTGRRKIWRITDAGRSALAELMLRNDEVAS